MEKYMMTVSLSCDNPDCQVSREARVRLKVRAESTLTLDVYALPLYQMGSNPVEDMRKFAEEQGWQFVNGQSFCIKCHVDTGDDNV